MPSSKTDTQLIVRFLKRKTIGSPTGLEPPSLVSLVDRARLLHEDPKHLNSNFLKFLEKDLLEAERCIAAVRVAVDNPPKLKKYRGPK